jgi:hypothetical protein
MRVDGKVFLTETLGVIRTNQAQSNLFDLMPEQAMSVLEESAPASLFEIRTS